MVEEHLEQAVALEVAADLVEGPFDGRVVVHEDDLLLVGGCREIDVVGVVVGSG